MKIKSSAKLLPEAIAVITTAYKEGFSINALSFIFRVDRTTIRWHLIKQGLYIKRRPVNFPIYQNNNEQILGEIIEPKLKKDKQIKIIDCQPNSYIDYIRKTKQFNQKQKKEIIGEYNRLKNRPWATMPVCSLVNNN